MVKAIVPGKSAYHFCSEALIAHLFKWTLLMLLTSSLLAAPIPAGYKQEDEYKSQTQDTIARVYRGNPYDWTGHMQVRVFRTEPPKTDGYLLWEGENRASVLVSFDGASIAINHHVMSDTGLLCVFTRNADGTYKKIDLDFTDKTLRLFNKQLGFKEAPAFDHLYCYAEQWLTDHQLLGVLIGHMSGEHALDGFWFIYDCRTSKFTFDLTPINKNAFHKKRAE